jgi:hypothetical protein
MNTKYEHAKFIIERFDHLYDTINNKGSFYIGLNTFILGGICAGYVAVGDKIDKGVYFWILLGSIFLLCIVAILYTINAISPFLRDNQNNENTPSLIYFGGIARYNLNTFISKVETNSNEEILEDMRRQAHCLATGLISKFRKLRVVSFLLLLQLIIIAIIFIYLVKNYIP